MEKSEARRIYVNMSIGTLGMLLFIFACLKYIPLETNMIGFLLVFLGFIVVVHYVYYLEKKAGISNKLIWIRAAILVIATISLGYTFY